LGVPLPPQVWGAVQPPQSTGVPQLLVTVPHLPAQRTPINTGTHVPVAHTLGVPPPPQLWPAGQPPASAPQVTAAPQLSITVPQFLPAQVVDAGCDVQPHAPTVPPPPQLWGAAQVPQLTVAPQLSVAGPQVLPAQVVAIACGVQPHTLGVPPPPHVSGAVQVPQLSCEPQLSVAVPQRLPWQAAAGSEVQPHTLASLPPPHVSPTREQVPQSINLQPFHTMPQFRPRRVQSVVQARSPFASRAANPPSHTSPGRRQRAVHGSHAKPDGQVGSAALQAKLPSPSDGS
jgi:hypothetical protein